MEKVQWNSIDKKQNGLKYSKNDKSSTLPRQPCIIIIAPVDILYTYQAYTMNTT